MSPDGPSAAAPDRLGLAVLLYAPTGRDAPLIRDVLSRAGHRVAVLDSIEALCLHMADDGGVAILAEEVLTPAAGQCLFEALGRQPSWSDIPLIVLTTTLAMQRPVQSTLRTLRVRGNVTLLERPVHPVTVLSAVDAGLRARQRQYEVRDYLNERERTEEQVRQAQKMDAVGQLAGGVAHEVNNMMTVVLGFGEFALGRLRRAMDDGCPLDPAALRAEIEEMVKAGRRSAAITQQLLAFSRRQRREMAVLRLQEVVPELDKLLRRLVGASIELAFRFPGDLPPIRADRTQIEQAIINLVINARDAMDGPGTITVSGDSLRLDAEWLSRHGVAGAPDGRWIQLAVSDTGRGMDREIQERAFEPFFTTKPVGEGTGLGLSTVYGMIRQNGGHVRLYSEPGLGTTVKLYLPECDGAAVPPEPVVESAPGGGEGVLVVEDEPVVRSLTRRTLEEAGYRVFEADDGRAALRLLAAMNGRIRLVLSDVVMPGMAGLELARVLRAERPELPVLFMSGYHDEHVTDRGLLPPGAPFIQKPFSPDELTRRVRSLLDAAGSPVGAGVTSPAPPTAG